MPMDSANACRFLLWSTCICHHRGRFGYGAGVGSFFRGGRNAHRKATCKSANCSPTLTLGNTDLEVVPVVVPKSTGRWEGAPAIES